MENLNAEQIKKALAICALGDCQACHYNKFIAGCRDELCGDSLALINSQEQRIKELTEKNEKADKVITDLIREGETYLKQREAFQSRVKYLEKENARLVEDNHILATEFKDKVKADTVRKMQERLKAECNKYLLHSSITLMLHHHIDQIAKEMLEGENER